MIICSLMIISAVCATDDNNTVSSNQQITQDSSNLNELIKTENKVIKDEKQIKTTKNLKTTDKTSDTTNDKVSDKTTDKTNEIEKTQTKQQKTVTTINKVNNSKTNEINTKKSIKTANSIADNEKVYVSPSGSDKNNGSVKTPFKTLEKTFNYALNTSNKIKYVLHL